MNILWIVREVLTRPFLCVSERVTTVASKGLNRLKKKVKRQVKKGFKSIFTKFRSQFLGAKPQSKFVHIERLSTLKVDHIKQNLVIKVQHINTFSFF